MKKKPKLNFRTLVWPKYVLSAGVLVAATAITLGSIYGYSQNSDAKKGKVNPTSPAYLRNTFAQTNEAKASFISSDKTKYIGDYDINNNTLNGQTIEDFLDKYYKENKSLPIQKINYGTFTFYNEYIEAVSPKEFFKFTQWFMNNVSWGPEIITLKSFSIVKGVEQKGNSITLGSHANKNKEYTTIQFFPDAFFGALPLYSETAGQGNAQESLLYKLNNKLLTSEELKTFLSSVPKYNSLVNINNTTLERFQFRNIHDYRSLIGKKVFVVKNSNWVSKVKSLAKPINNVEKGRYEIPNDYLLLINGSNETEAKKNLKSKLAKYLEFDKYELLKDIDSLNLVEKKISFVSIDPNLYLDSEDTLDRYLNVVFDDGTTFNLFRSFADVQYAAGGTRFTSDKSREIVRGFNDSKNRIIELFNKYEDNLKTIAIKAGWNDKDFNDFLEYFNTLLETQEEISLLTTELDTLINEINNNEILNNELTNLRNKINNLTSQKQNKEQEIQTLSQQISDLEIRINNLKESNSPYDDEERELNTLQQNKQKIENILKNIVSSLQNAENKINEKSQQVFSSEVKNKKIDRKTEIDNRLNELNSRSRSLTILVDDFLKDYKFKNELKETIIKLFEYKNNDLYKNALTDDEDPKTIEPSVLKDKATNYDALYFNYDESLKELTAPILGQDGQKSYTRPKYEPYIYYTNDIAYLPNQIISSESLIDLSTSAQLNWRDFYNLDGWFRSEKDRLTDPNSNENNTEVYVYSTKLKSLEEEFKKKYPNSAITLNFKELQEEYQQLGQRSNELYEKKIAHENLTWDSSAKNVDSVSTIMGKWFTNSIDLPENYKLLGTSGSEPVFPDRNAFLRFTATSYEVLEEYLNYAYNGMPSSRIPSIKNGFKLYYENLMNKIKSAQPGDFDLLLNLVKERLNLAKKISHSETQDINDKIQIHKLFIESINKAQDWENKYKNETWYLSFSQILNLYQLNEDFKLAIKQVKKQIAERDQYIEDSAEALLTSLDRRIIKFKLDFLTNTPTFTNDEVNKKYTELINYVTNLRSKAKSKAIEASQMLINWFKSRAEITLNRIKSLDIEPAFDIYIENNGDVSKLEENVSNLERQYNALKEQLNVAKTTLDTAKLSLINKYKETLQGTNETANDRAKQLILDQIKIFTDYESGLDQQLLLSRTLAAQKAQELDQFSLEYNNAKNDAERATVEAKIDQTTIEIRNINDSIRMNKEFVKSYSIIRKNLEERLSEVENDRETYRIFISISDRFVSELSNVIDNPGFGNFVPEYSRKFMVRLRNNARELRRSFTINIEALLNGVASLSRSYDEALSDFSAKEKATNSKFDNFQTSKNKLDIFNEILNNTDYKREVENIKQLHTTTDQLDKDQKTKRKEVNEIFPFYKPNVNKSDPTQTEELWIQLQNNIQKSVEEILKEENEISKELDLTNTSSELTSLKEALDAKKESSGFNDSISKFNDKLEEYSNIINELNDEYKKLIQLKFLSGRFNTIQARQDAKDEIRSTEIGNAKDEILDKFFDLIDNTSTYVEKQQMVVDNIPKRAVQLAANLIAMADSISQKTAEISPESKAYINKLQDLFKNYTMKIYSYFDANDLQKEFINEELSNLGVKIANITRELSKSFKKDKSIQEYKTKIDNVQKLLKELYLKLDFEKAIDSTTSYLRSIMNNKNFQNDNKDKYLYLMYGKWFVENNSNKIDELDEQLTKIEQDEYNPINNEKETEENTKSELEDEWNSLQEEIDELKNQGQPESAYKDKLDRQAEIDVELNNIETRIADLEQQISDIETRYNEIEELKDSYDNLLEYFGDNEYEIDDSIKYDPATITSPFDRRVFLNSAVDKYISSIKNLDDKILKVKEFLLDFKNYFKLYISDSDKDVRLDEVYRTAIKFSVEKMREIKVKLLVNKNRQETLYDSNNLGDELQSANDLIVAKSRIELIDILTKKGVVDKNAQPEEINKFIHKMNLTNIDKKDSKLVITLRETRKPGEVDFGDNYNQYYLKYHLDANVEDTKNDRRLSAINDLFATLKYNKTVAPVIIKEDGKVKDPITNKSVKGYSVFADAYQGLTRQLLTNVPYSGEWLNGEHLESFINEKGVMDYRIVNGPYLGFTKDTRVGLWAILKMSDPNFKGISTDFLKFVGAHEYGHHMTLNSASDLGDKGSNPLYVSSLTPGTPSRIDNYYNKNVLELYLKARTHLNIGTTRLLDENNVVVDYGEYGVWKLPKMVEQSDGSFKLEYEDEKEADIWGTKLDDNDIKETINNKKRRFLLTFKGIIDAVRARRAANNLTGKDEKYLQAFDIWIMNSLDHLSGTLNPSVFNGTAKYLVWDETKQSYVFTPGSLAILKGILKDGSGKEIEFENINGEVEPIIVKGRKNADGKYVEITEVAMKTKHLKLDANGNAVKDANGNDIYELVPVIKVPLNVDLEDTNSPYYDAGALEYVNKQIETIRSSIKSLIVEKFSINGWDDSDTNIDLDSKLILEYSHLKSLLPKSFPDGFNIPAQLSFMDQIRNRDVINGGLLDPNRRVKIYDKEGNELNENSFTDRSFFLNVEKIPRVPLPNLVDKIKYMFIAAQPPNNLDQFSRSMGQVLHVANKKQFIPNVKLDDSLHTIGFLSYLPAGYDEIFKFRKLLSNYSQYVGKIIGINKSESTWLLQDNKNNVLPKDSSYLGNVPDFTNFNNLALNVNSLSDNIDNSLFDSFFVNQGGTKLFGKNIKFKDNFDEFIDFTSIDLSKATLDKVNKVVNWDISYVQQKFDIDLFKLNFQKALDKDKILDQESKDKYLELLNSNDKQRLANEIMRRYSESKLAMNIQYFTMQDILDNHDLAWVFDQKLGYGLLKVEGFNVIDPNKEKWEIDIDEFLKTFQSFAYENNLQLNQLGMFEVMIFENKIQTFSDQVIARYINHNDTSLIGVMSNMINGFFKKAKPTNNVIEYYAAKTERKFNEFFSDYTYNYAEIINRDNLQITYSPSSEQFGNMPGFLTGISEATTGLEYVVDGEATAKWNNLLNKFDAGSSKIGIKNIIFESETYDDEERKRVADNLGLKYKQKVFANNKDFNDGISAYSNSFFGSFRTINNGWFKDRWYREFLNFQMYDDQGKPVEDDTIRIKNLKNEKVTNRVEAYWQFYIQSQGVGKRTLSTIWRDSDKDAVAMFGYLSNDVASQAEFIAFEDVKTGEVKKLHITKQHTNNMFYYKTQNPENEEKFMNGDKSVRHTLDDEEYNYTDKNGTHIGKGFTAWVSDYAVMSQYRDRLLTPGHEYRVYFADAKGNKVLEMDLGENESVSENGKTFSQAPIAVFKHWTNPNVNKEYETRIKVDHQFNGVIA
ncbi:PDxFFG protein [Mycoplasmopsis lipofaciens]|uniref:PDxFFG protein n=1 Tax=Mycoplasmopsis lipofaciens TaxID=114884 RepID=UPI00055B5035|nr:PDxFFG protein [Mycoplasmopsis lipofaciens]